MDCRGVRLPGPTSGPRRKSHGCRSSPRVRTELDRATEINGMMARGSMPSGGTPPVGTVSPSRSRIPTTPRHCRPGLGAAGGGKSHLGPGLRGPFSWTRVDRFRLITGSRIISLAPNVFVSRGLAANSRRRGTRTASRRRPSSLSLWRSGTISVGGFLHPRANTAEKNSGTAEASATRER